jgi:hypothetical protein
MTTVVSNGIQIRDTLCFLHDVEHRASVLAMFEHFP